jgi:PAS domain S-box-containing protein
MDTRSLRTLIVEDSEDDVPVHPSDPSQGGYDPLHRRVEPAEELRRAVRAQTWDIGLSDYHLPLFSGLEAISLLRETGPDIPLIIVSGAIGEETAIQSMKAGACDYVMKGNLSRLIPAVERELKEAESRRARQRAEADLRESEHRFRFLAEQMVDIVWTADRNFRTTYVSPSVTRVLGFAPEERLSHSLEEAVTPASYNAIMKRFEEEMARRQTEGIDPDRAVVMEVEYRHKNGGTVWMENTVRGIWDDGGNLLGIHGVARDLTERKQAEAALQEKQARLEDAYRLARLGIWNWDRDTGALFWSDELYRLFGRDPSLPPPSLAEHARIYAPGCWERQRERNKRALQTGESYRIELEYTHTDGTRRWITSFGGPLYDPSGRIRGLQGTVQDITERRQAQEIRRREEEWKNLLFWLYEEAPKRGEKEIFDHTLERICALSGSAIGFFHQVSDDQRTLILTSWNRKALETCTALYNQHYTLDSAGNWVDCVREKRPFIYNDFPSSPNQKGLPEGHVPITRLLTVPVLEGDKVRIIFGVGNKPEPMTISTSSCQLMANDLQTILAKRRVEASLRESERRYREMLDLAPVTVFEADAAGRILSFNPAEYFTFLLPRGAIEQDRSLFDFVAPEEREHAKRHFKGVLQGKTSRMREYPMLRSDGSVFPGMILSRAISRGDRNIGLRGVVVDLSEIRPPGALRLSEEKVPQHLR